MQLDSWYHLRDHGILQERLVDHVWKDFEKEKRHQLLEIMKQFDLICDAPRDEEHCSEGNQEKADETLSDSGMNFLVPSMFTPGNVRNLEDTESVIFYADFHGLFTGNVV